LPPVVWQLAFPWDISKDMVLLSNTSRLITNSDLELATEVLAWHHNINQLGLAFLALH
jgi:hypothetical protein